MSTQTYAIRILDQCHKQIGELLVASISDVRKYIAKGFIVVDITTGMELTDEQMLAQVGVSDGVILEG